MKTESIEIAEKHLLLGWCRKWKNLFVGIGYLAGAHAFDALYAIVSKAFSYFTAIGIMVLILGSVSIIFVFGHKKIKEKYDWDALELDHLNALRSEKDIPRKMLWKRFQKWMMQRRITIFIFGSIAIGPPVITILLRKCPDDKVDNAFYIFSGTLLSVVFWVSSWTGFWFVWASIKQAMKLLTGL